jgi:hypothetical protein
LRWGLPDEIQSCFSSSDYLWQWLLAWASAGLENSHLRQSSLTIEIKGGNFEAVRGPNN